MQTHAGDCELNITGCEHTIVGCERAAADVEIDDGVCEYASDRCEPNSSM
jgi:hypothetical protein